MEDAGLAVSYEEEKIPFVWPERDATYLPDFKLPSNDGGFFYIEAKGIWAVEDRQKHLLIREQHPELDIRFVFSNQNAKLYKNSPTSYAQWCEKHGFLYAHKAIPDSWLHSQGETNNESN
jgi:hypothetical protein